MENILKVLTGGKSEDNLNRKEKRVLKRQIQKISRRGSNYTKPKKRK